MSASSNTADSAGDTAPLSCDDAESEPLSKDLSPLTSPTTALDVAVSSGTNRHRQHA